MGGEGSTSLTKGSIILQPEEAKQWHAIQSRIAQGSPVFFNDEEGKRGRKVVNSEVLQVAIHHILESEDTELADAVRALTWKALAQANEIMDNGTPRDRMVLVKALVSNAARLIGATSSTTVEEGRVAFAELMDNMRDKELVNASSTVKTITPTTDDSD